jgi:hypothetical protein
MASMSSCCERGSSSVLSADGLDDLEEDFEEREDDEEEDECGGGSGVASVGEGGGATVGEGGADARITRTGDGALKTKVNFAWSAVITSIVELDCISTTSSSRRLFR